ncbi:MAG: heat-inducible transcriptional repressor HrcA [Gammaproteobacteria bacterium]
MDDNIINDRAQSLLKTLVERYIEDGQPVGSATLARNSSIKLSSATIRNVMAELEELGLVHSPHTSAGRIPTVKGYRLFVDKLLTIKPLGNKTVHSFQQELAIEENADHLVEKASSLLSAVTQMAGVVMLPRKEGAVLRHIEFLPLAGNRVLVILVINEQEVQNKVIHTARTYSEAELVQTANFLNSEYAGSDLTRIREKLLTSMQQSRDAMTKIMQTAVEMTDQVMESSRRHDDFIMAGQTNLMSYAEMGDLDKLKQLFEAFNTKRDVLHILDQSIHAEAMQIYIGEESGYSVFDDCSVITSPYKSGEDIVGVLGIIGPTRMAYDRVIPVVDMTAKLLGSLLSSDK